jgi:hypothetical protein
MRLASALLGTAAIGLVAACTPFTTTASPPSKPSTPRVVATRYLPVPAGVLPLGATTEPADFATRPRLPNCGAISAFTSPDATPSTAQRAADDAVIRCWLKAHADGGSAEAWVIGGTTDAGPAYVYLRTFGGQVEEWFLFRDQMIGPSALVTWGHWHCREIRLLSPVTSQCTP